MRASSLVLARPVESAGLVVTIVADGVDNVVQHVVLGDPAVGVVEAAGEVVHRVGAAEGQLAAAGV